MSAWGRGRALAGVALIALVVSGALVSGCGGSSTSVGTSERARDIEVINVAIAQDLTLVDAYRHGRSILRDPQLRAVIRRYVAQEQEHLDGLTKVLRGLGGKVEAEAEELDYTELKSADDYLRFAYELTSAQLAHFLEDVTQLSTPAPQSYAASIAANEAQHLVVLRQALGADLLEAVPDAFDTGEVPPPPAAPPGKG
ncbi:MAG: ferritin-like domain-containing protein [Solirubrobacterales bacterium]